VSFLCRVGAVSLYAYSDFGPVMANNALIASTLRLFLFALRSCVSRAAPFGVRGLDRAPPLRCNSRTRLSSLVFAFNFLKGFYFPSHPLRMLLFCSMLFSSAGEFLDVTRVCLFFTRDPPSTLRSFIFPSPALSPSPSSLFEEDTVGRFQAWCGLKIPLFVGRFRFG